MDIIVCYDTDPIVVESAYDFLMSTFSSDKVRYFDDVIEEDKELA